MSGRSSRRKEKNDNSTELYKGNCYEGTSARTRPFSFDEIMLKRKNKKLSADVKDAVGVASAILKGNVDNDADRFGIETVYNQKEGSLLDAALARASEESTRLSSRKREKRTSVEDNKISKNNYKYNHGSENKLKANLREDVSYKAKTDRFDKHFRSKRKNDEWSTENSESEPGERHSRDFVGKDRFVDRRRKISESEHKRKHRSGDEEKNRDRSIVKKHEPRKWHNLESLEKKGRRESPPSRYEDSRAKRRRSRSRERVNNRDRSTSISPMAQKPTSYHGRDRGDLSSHSLKERSGRQSFEFDRSKISGNGSSSHYRRHGGSTSGLGGYSPRKRKSEVAVRTPSPIKRSPEKKNVGWDLPPPGTDSHVPVSVLSTQSSDQTEPLSVNKLTSVAPVALTAAMPASGGSSNTLSLMTGTSIESIELTQATRPMRRIYVENVPASASEKSLMECLNKFLLSSGSSHISGTQPCISSIIHKEKGHAFVEFLTPEDASAALSFDGRSFFGSVLKIRRPKDFVEVTTGVLEKSVAAVDAISDMVMDSPHKIFIGGISEILSSEMVMEIVSAFGPLKAYRFQFNEDLNGPCAFLEYVDQSVTLKACAGLNGVKMGGQVLTVVQALPDASLVENTGSPPFYGIPEHAKPLLEKPTQILQLKNVINPEMLSSVSESELEEILEDIRLECARFGTIKSVNVVKHNHHVTMTNNVGSAGSIQDVACDDKNRVTEGIDLASGGIVPGKPELPSHVELEERLDRVGECNSINDDQPPDAPLKDELHELGQIDGTRMYDAATSGEISNQLDNINDQTKSLDDKVSDNNKIGLGMENVNGMQLEASLAVAGSKTGPDAIEKVENGEQVNNFNDVFEVGSVLVEYKRTEASCIAAHCLQGRVFGNQIVLVSYVAPDAYQAKFPR